MKEFVEQQIIGAVRKLLTGKVNEMLGDIQKKNEKRKEKKGRLLYERFC